jgi:hypothetical protein
MSGSRKVWTAAEDDYIRANAAVMTGPEFAKHYGVSLRAFHQHCYRMGIKIKKENVHLYPAELIQQARLLYRSTDMQQKQIAAMLGINPAYIKGLLRHDWRRRDAALPLAQPVESVIAKHMLSWSKAA